MKKSFQKTLISLTLVMALLVCGISYQTNSAKAADEQLNYNVVLEVGIAESVTATAGTPVEYSFSLEAGDPFVALCYTSVLTGVKAQLYNAATNEQIDQVVLPNTEFTQANQEGIWLYSEALKAYSTVLFGLDAPVAGEYKISLTFDDDTSYILYGEQVKASEPAENPYLTYSSITVTKGFSQKLDVNDNTSAVTWKSSTPSVATVDKNGKVTGKKAGKATITASLANGKTLTCKVTVKENAFSVTKLTAKKVSAGKAVMDVYNVSYSKGNLVIKARFINNTSHKVTSLKNIKITIKNEKGKVIGVYTAKSAPANVKKGKVKDYTFTIKKSKLKIKTTQDLRKIKYPTSTGTYVYSVKKK